MDTPRSFHRSTVALERVNAGRRLPLLPWLSALTAILFALLAATGGTLLASFIEQTTLARDGETITQLINSIVHVEQATGFFLSGGAEAHRGDIEEFVSHLGNVPSVLRANAYGIDRTVLWSSDPELIGKRFLDNQELESAFRGEPVIESGTVGEPAEKAEHVQLGTPGERFVENYLPIHGQGPDEPDVVGVIEIYRTPVSLFEGIRDSARRAWFGVAALGLLTYASLLALLWRAELAVRRQQAALVSAEQLATAGEMASAVAHGLRNPLASIRSSAELGLECEAQGETRGLLTEIIENADRLEGWIRQYLASARAGAAADAPADPRAVIEASLAEYRPLLARTGVTLDASLPERLPAVKLHPVILGQLLNSLLANAGEASAAGSSVQLRAATLGRKRVLIEVQDEGPGLTPADAEQAFTPFVTTKRSGLGLGLPIARETLERHGGRLHFTSRPGFGTTVGLELPVAAGAVA
jgi:signal transduction histidine kinase